jgi:tape measure domain-containing protein
MASIDERVVAMSFENAKFEAGVAQTMATLGKLDAAIRNIGAVNGLSNIEAAASKVTLQGPMSALDRLRAKLGMAGSNAADGFGQIDQAANKVTLEGPSSALDRLRAKFGIGVTREAADAFSEVEKDADKVDLKGVNDAIDNTAGHFSVMSTAAAVALGNIASEAARKGLAVAKSFTLDPIKEGFKGYETQINAVQTIMANTGLKGQKGLGTVTATLKELQKYANQTVYNFSDMAKNIGTFTAAGVKLKPATESIKGIANLAALSGSSAQQASGAMYQLSQAIAAGKVNLQDWNSVTNAGIGGAVFQKNLVRTAMAMGTLNKGIVKGVDGTGKLTINGQTFRNSIASIPGGPPPWLTSKVLTTSLSTFTGDMTKAQLAALGFNDKAAQSILEQGKTAQDAATKIKTLSQMMEALKEEVATAYATIFKTIFGNFFQARDVFSKLHVVIENGLTKPIYAVNKLLEGWAKLGGRTKLIDALKQGFGDISALIKPVKDAFREVFPPASAKSLLNITNGFDRLMHSLRIGPETANNLKRTFAGVFAVLHIGVTIVTDIAKVLGHLLGVVGHGSGGIFAFTGGLGDMLVALDKAISSGKGLAGVFTGLESALKVPINLIKEFASAIAGLFGKNDRQGPQQFSDGIANLTKQFRPLSRVLTIVQAGFQGLKNFLANTGLDQMFNHIGDVVRTFAAKLGASFKNGDYKAVFAGLQTGLIGGIFLTLKKALGGGMSVDLGGGLLKNLNASLKVLTGTLVAMQKNIMAGTLLKIAEAIGILAISVFALSKVDPKRLGSSMTAISVGLGELIGAMKLLTGVGGKGAFATMPIIAGSLIMLAGAVDVLAIAVFAFSKLSWMELVKGLAGVAGSLAAVGAGAKLISGPNLLAIGPGLILLGVGLNVVASAIVILGNMRFDKLLTGLFGIAGALAAMGLGMEAIGPDILIIGPGLIAVGIGLTFLAGAVGYVCPHPGGESGQGHHRSRRRFGGAGSGGRSHSAHRGPAGCGSGRSVGGPGGHRQCDRNPGQHEGGDHRQGHHRPGCRIGRPGCRSHRHDGHSARCSGATGCCGGVCHPGPGARIHGTAEVGDHR